ncbi:MAG: chloride channel protein [Pseudomonadota bacterium]
MAFKLKTPESVESFRRRLAEVDALPQLAALGMLTGLVTAAVILSFRWVVELCLGLLPGNDIENFEGLDLSTRIILIMGGAVTLGVLLNRYSPSARRVGVVHVMERLSLHQGRLPLKNALIQFLGGAIALTTGQSGGREGPAIHLGATAASLLGQQFKVPNNSLRTLVACGTAAAIASSFNTPIAGVIFAMEVVMMEYTIGSFIPVIIAAVTSTILTQVFFSTEVAFTTGAAFNYSIAELPYLLLVGILIGAVAAGFTQLIQRFARLVDLPFWLRLVLAGSITAAASVLFPQVMGVGYDTVNDIMLTQLSIVLLIALAFAKLVTSAAAVGLGMPVGLIGPTFFIGATMGGVFGNMLQFWTDSDVSVGFYVMLGMCAMMGAVLQAPLAALMAVLEMTTNTQMILPAMLTIVVATMTNSQVFRQKSVFISTLNTLGLQYPPSPVTLHLQRVGVASIMDRDFVRLPEQVDQAQAQQALDAKPNWIVVGGDQIKALLNPADLAVFLAERGAEEESINLMQLPGQRMDVTTISSQATVMQLQNALDKTGAEACCVTRTTAPMIAPVVGVVTQSHINNYRDNVQ